MIEIDSRESSTQTPATTGELRVLPFEDSIAERWDEFVKEQQGGSIFHLTAWKRAIERTFSYRPRYLRTERNGRITAVAPVFLVSNWIIGKALISAPLGVYGGICSEDEESTTALLDALSRMARSEKIDYVELRTRNGRPLAGYHTKRLYSTFTTTLDPDVEQNLKRLPRDTRYMIRKAGQFHLTVRHGLEQLDQFYSLFAISMRRLGTPVFPKSLFSNLIHELHGSVDLMLVYAGSEPVTGVLSFIYRDTILPYYAGATDKARTLAANNFMYWELMKFAVELGLKGFDFGRSKENTGAYAFKSQWNMEITPLPYQVSLIKGDAVPNFSPANPKFQFATRVWSRIPLKATMLFGPRVVRWFP